MGEGEVYEGEEAEAPDEEGPGFAGGGEDAWDEGHCLFLDVGLEEFGLLF